MRSVIQALVIGNSKYPARLALTSPTQDATRISEIFRELRIDTIEAIDQPREKLSELIDNFVSRSNLKNIDVSILYYSGHGIQVNDENYIVPIDFRDRNDLMAVQSIVDRISSATTMRIIFLDACRTGIDGRVIIGGKGIEVNKAFFMDGVEVTSPGLAEMKAAGNTFIAFAAGPGEVARDGIAGSPLSPFTQALAKHLASVDLPISNLTGRIRQEVLAETEGGQRTWDQSSLVIPFYFNPGSLLMFAGNLMALSGILISFVICSFVLLSPRLSAGWVSTALFLPATSFLVLFAGAQRVYSRLRGKALGPEEQTLCRQLLASLYKGAAGGFLGSLVGGLVLGCVYYWKWNQVGQPNESLGQVCLEVTLATIAAGCCLGALALSGARACLESDNTSILPRRLIYRILLGSALGGVLAGLIAAPPITAYFGSLDRPEMTPGMLLPGSIVGAAALVFSIVNFDLERLSGRRVRAGTVGAVLALLAAIPITGLVFGPLYLVGVVATVTSLMERNAHSVPALLAGGVAYGIPVGLVLGSVIGLAIVITQVRSGKSPC